MTFKQGRSAVDKLKNLVAGANFAIHDSEMDAIPRQENARGEAQLVYGKSEGGRIIHISVVPSGLACRCTCPACDRKLVAKHCTKKVDHFAHYQGDECEYASETALHLLAKQALEECPRLWLPPWKVSEGARRQTLMAGSEFVFDAVVLEVRFGQVIPDVLVRKGDRELLVEIFVTHRCDETKISKIREMNLAAIEIDLSDLAYDAPPDVIRDAVLRGAPRWWLSNLKLEAKETKTRKAWRDEERREQYELWLAQERERQRAEHEARSREERLERRAHEIIDVLQNKSVVLSYNRRLVTLPVEHLKKHGLSKFIGVAIKGSLSLRNPSDEWQAFLIDRLILREPSNGDGNFTTDWALKNLKRAGLIEDVCAGFIDDDLESRVRAAIPGFRSPYRVVRDFLRQLESGGLIIGGGKRWMPIKSARSPLSSATARSKRQRVL